MNRKKLTLSGLGLVGLLLSGALLTKEVAADDSPALVSNNSATSSVENREVTKDNMTVDTKGQNKTDAPSLENVTTDTKTTSVLDSATSTTDLVKDNSKEVSTSTDDGRGVNSEFSPIAPSDSVKASSKEVRASAEEGKGVNFRSLRAAGPSSTGNLYSEKAKQYIQSITGKYEYNTVKYTVTMKEDFKNIASFSAYNASNGERKRAESIVKINNRIFEARIISPTKGEWRPLSAVFNNKDDEKETFNRRDLLAYRANVVTPNATRVVDPNLVMESGRKVAVAIDKRAANYLDTVKYTIKFADRPFVRDISMDFINDRTGAKHSIRESSYPLSTIVDYPLSTILDDNGNTVLYRQVDRKDYEYGTYRLTKVRFSDDSYFVFEGTQISHLYDKASLSIEGAPAEPVVELRLNNKKSKAYANYREVHRGELLTYTVKVANRPSPVHLTIRNVASTVTQRTFVSNVDSKGNFLFYFSTANLPAGIYTVDMIDYSLRQEDIDLSEATFRVIEKGLSVRREQSKVTPDKQIMPSSEPTTTKPIAKVTRTARAQKHLQSITGANHFGTLVYTIKTKGDFADLDSLEIFDAHSGNREARFKGKKINNRTFEITFENLKAGDWRPNILKLINMENERISFGRRDMLDQRVSVLNKGAVRAVDQVPSIKVGQTFGIVVDKHQVKVGDTVKYTLKVAQEEIRPQSIDLIDLRTGKKLDVPAKLVTLDNNGNGVYYHKITSEGVYVPDFIIYDTKIKSFYDRREKLYLYDAQTMVMANHAAVYKSVQPRVVNGKNGGLFANYSQVQRGTLLTYTVKENVPYSYRKIILTNTRTSFKKIYEHSTVDGNGNKLYYIPTWELSAGDYTASMIYSYGDINSVSDVTDASFRVVEKGIDIRRTPTPLYKSQWVRKNYYDANGNVVKSKWIFDKKYNSWFYLDSSGNYVENAWQGEYYLKSGGYMAKKEWIYDKKYKSYFYLKADGRYARNEWQGEYYLKSGGYMAKKEWIYDKKYKSHFYLKADGKYARNEWQGEYYLKSGGYMAKKEWIYDKKYKSYFYLKADGRYARNEWVGNYYLGANGKMAINKWIGKYYVDIQGKWTATKS
ncbi:N-acetylmuramoyl-L-alanine amidase family protein [Streptococcus cristatus]|uniref:N-acetylmuramoyl-L-alanine amidase family protein n=1 Tax=Streptococcus cristatus TaxID=45634 RepID=UPI000F675B55|nr:N-acetylmuramoyl-L-alanine amidase family protein [Streptococcus cristatus]RSJ73014.1 putative endo-beta-N-acetylglucosaminidase precursor [Streptococcus cristatus]